MERHPMDRASLLSSLTYSWARIFINDPKAEYAMPKDSSQMSTTQSSKQPGNRKS